MLLLSCRFYLDELLEYLLTTTLELELNLVYWSTGLDDLKFPEFVRESVLSGVWVSEEAALPRGATPSIF